MRELILQMSVSLDGFVSGPDGEAKWIFSGDQEAIAWKVKNMWNASLHIMGSRSFQHMASFFPTATTVFAPPMNQIPKAVFSKQGPAVLNTVAATINELRDTRVQTGDNQAGPLQPGAESWGGGLCGQRRPGRRNQQVKGSGRQADLRPRRRRLRA
jgi:dihydrofolate reductase